ncbi:MAG: hypothetical protein JO345_33335 [Streptosporangiaceae bacterium]|nr:hypothetical protein [Streptosporangiaceae bacterium]
MRAVAPCPRKNGAVPATAALASPSLADVLAKQAVAYTHAKEPAYVLVTPTMLAYARAYGVPPPFGFQVLLESLAHSPAGSCSSTGRAR